jgi:hypothetical protein
MEQIELFYTAMMKNDTERRVSYIFDVRAAQHADSKKLKPYIKSLEKAAK